MTSTYELPATDPYTDFSEYVGLLLGVIEDVLDNPYNWEEADRTEALSLMGSLKAYIMEIPTMLIQTGFCIDTASPVTPDGFLECNGAAVSRTEYARLFAEISTTYGAGDGTTTFNVPDFPGRTAVYAGTGTGLTARLPGQKFGEETHVLTIGESAAHTHNADTSTILAKASGTAGTSNRLLRGTDANTNSNVVNQLTMTTDSKGGGGAHNNMQPSLVVRKVIKT